MLMQIIFYRILQSQLKCNPSTSELGVELFYYILSLLNEETNTYLPSKTLFTTCLEKLGQVKYFGLCLKITLKNILNFCSHTYAESNTKCLDYFKQF